MTAFTDHLLEANRDSWAAMAWVQQDRAFVVEERRVVAALRAHGLSSGLDDLLAGLDRSLVLEAEAFARTAAEHGFSPEVEPWPVCLGSTCFLRCAADDGVLDGLSALYAAERAYLDTWAAVAGRSPADSAYHASIQNWSGQAWPG